MPEKSGETTFDIERVKAIAWRRLPWLVTPLVVLVPIVLAAVAALPNEYQASSRLLVQEPFIDNPLETQRPRRISPAQRRFNMEQRMLSNDSLLRVVTELGLDREVLHDTAVQSLIARIKSAIPMLKQPAPVDEARLKEQLMARLSRRIGVKMIGDQVIEVSYRGINSSLNARIVNTLVRGFMEDSLGSQRKVAQDSFNFLKKTRDEYKQKLEESQKRWREFQEKHLLNGAPDVVASSGALRADMQRLVEEKVRRDLLLAELDYVEQQIEKQEQEVTTQRVTAANPQAAELEQQLARHKSELGVLTAMLTDKNPRVVAKKATIKTLEQELERIKKETVTSEIRETNPVYQSLLQRKIELEPQIEAQNARIAAVQQRVDAAQRRISDIPAEDEERRKLERDYQLNLSLYNQLSRQLASADISVGLTEEQQHTETFKILQPARESTIPIGPDRLRLTAIGVVLSLALGIAATAAIEFIDQSFRDASEAQDYLSLPLLATVPPIMTAAELRYRRLRRALALGALIGVLAVEAIAGLFITNIL